MQITMLRIVAIWTIAALLLSAGGCPLPAPANGEILGRADETRRLAASEPRVAGLAYERWRTPGYFRGANVRAHDADHGLTAEDFQLLRAAGANLVQLSLPGIRDTAPPHAPTDESIHVMDELVALATGSGLYFTIAVRSGPGRIDVDIETASRHSTLWEQPDQRAAYAEMLGEIVVRYQSHPGWVGIAPLVAPNPLEWHSPTADTPGKLRALLASRSISLGAIYQSLIAAIREVDATLPVLIQAPGRSAPHFFEILSPVDDPFVVYEVHNFYPQEFTLGDGASYPGIGWNPTSGNNAFWDINEARRFMAHVLLLQRDTSQPIFLSRFGVQRVEHPDTARFLTDMIAVCDDFGWHFAVWKFGGGEFDAARAGEAWQTLQQGWRSSPTHTAGRAEIDAFLRNEIELKYSK